MSERKRKKEREKERKRERLWLNIQIYTRYTLFSVELVLESSNSVFFTPTITLFVAFVVPLRAAIPALGAFLINVFAAAFAPPQ